MGQFQRTELIKRMLKTGGGHSMIANAIYGHRGYASVVANVKANIYKQKAKAMLQKSACASWSWDGAGYGGLSVNVCFAVDPISLNGAHCAPMVHRGSNVQAARCKIGFGTASRRPVAPNFSQNRTLGALRKDNSREVGAPNGINLSRGAQKNYLLSFLKPRRSPITQYCSIFLESPRKGSKCPGQWRQGVSIAFGALSPWTLSFCLFRRGPTNKYFRKARQEPQFQFCSVQAAM
jgi:hypothetical protein